MEAKRMRFSENAHISQQFNTSQNNVLELRIWQNMQIAECVDDNYINTLLENTREIVLLQRRGHLNEHHDHIENEAINEAIFSYGLKKSSISEDFDDDDDDDEEDSSDYCDKQQQLISSCSISPSTSNNCHSSSSSNTSNSSLEDFAINSAIKCYGLQKKKDGGDT